MNKEKGNFTYYVFDKEIQLKEYEHAFDVLNKLEEKYKNDNELFFSGFNIYKKNNEVVYLVDNRIGLQPCYSQPRRNRYEQLKSWNRK